MVAGDGGLDDRCNAFGKHAGEQHGTFHLRACDGHFVSDRRERGRMNPQRRTTGFFAERFDVRSHLAKRNRDAAHRTRGKRGIAKQLRGEILSRKQTRKQAHARAGIAAIDRFGRRLELHRLTVNAQVRWSVTRKFFDHLVIGAERLHRVERVKAVLAGKEVVDRAGAVGKPTKDGGAV